MVVMMLLSRKSSTTFLVWTCLLSLVSHLELYRECFVNFWMCVLGSKLGPDKNTPTFTCQELSGLADVDCGYSCQFVHLWETLFPSKTTPATGC